jgi:hypothetical protein
LSQGNHAYELSDYSGHVGEFVQLLGCDAVASCIAAQDTFTEKAWQ